MAQMTFGAVLRRIDRILQYLMAALVVCSLAAMVVVVLFLVISRFVFGLGYFWGEELARYLMIYMAFIGGAVALRSNQHPRLTLFVDMLPETGRRVVNIVVQLLLAATLIVLLWQGLDVALNEGRMRTPALRLRYFWILLAVPIGAGAMLIQLIAMHFLPNAVVVDEAEDVEEVYE
ncbi:MAG: TRAP transporter small permease [Pseudorhodobacter sp.]